MAIRGSDGKQFVSAYNIILSSIIDFSSVSVNHLLTCFNIYGDPVNVHLSPIRNDTATRCGGYEKSTFEYYRRVDINKQKRDKTK